MMHEMDPAGAPGLRPMRWWDVEVVVGIERDVFADTTWTAGQFWSELAQANRTYVVDEDGEGVAGYAGLMAVPPTADIQTIAVASRARGRGRGRALLEHLMSVAGEAGCSEILLEVRPDNARAMAMYEEAGFEVIARRASYYGPGADGLIMRRRGK